MGVVDIVQILQATCAFHSLDSPSAQIQFSTSRGWTEGEEQPHSLRFEFWLKYLSELLSSVRILVQTCAIGTAEVSEMGNYMSCQLGWTDCCTAHIYGPELNPQGKSEQRIDCGFFLKHLGVSLILPATMVFMGMFYWKPAASHNVSWATVLVKLHLEMTSTQL